MLQVTTILFFQFNTKILKVLVPIFVFTFFNNKERIQQISPTASRPVVQQIGMDKILLQWQLIDSSSGVNLDTIVESSLNQLTNANNIAYFKVEYKINKGFVPGGGSQSPVHNGWLVIDEQIDSRKREYILTDLNKLDTYRFRITLFMLNGELVHSHQSSRFKLDPNWTDGPSSSTFSTSSLSTISSNSSIQSPLADIRLAQIQMQITQMWAISSSSLGLRWKLFLNNNLETHSSQTNSSTGSVNTKSATTIFKKLNGFYIYYRKIEQPATIEPSSSNAIEPLSLPIVPLYNYTRVNLPISLVDDAGQHPQPQITDTYIIANLEPSTQYEIKMTCYNLNGDLCSFSNTIYGLTLASQSSQSANGIVQLNAAAANNKKLNNNSSHQATTTSASVVFLKSKQNELLFMILGVVLGILSLLLVIFVVMCIIRHRQHKKLLAQLHNTSQKLTSSSCPTLIYEDSLRNQHQNRLNSINNHHQHQQQQVNYAAARLLEANLFGIMGNNLTGATSSQMATCAVASANMNTNTNSSSNGDTNSTNSQSMSTTTSSINTPPGAGTDVQQLVLNASNSNNTTSSAAMTPSHILLLNGNSVSTAPISLSNMSNAQLQPLPPPPPIPQVPPPSMGGTGQSANTATLNRINISLNPLNSYLESSAAPCHMRNGGANMPMSPIKTGYMTSKQQQQQQTENFYHTLTTLGNLPITNAQPNLPLDLSK
jgi:hypothetical protein